MTINHQGWRWGVGLLLLGCGGAEPAPVGAEEPVVDRMPPNASGGTTPAEADEPSAAPIPANEAEVDPVEADPVEAEVRRCLPPAGVSGSPRTIAQAVELMNALPRPTTVACFVESLDRPLRVYLTSSKSSAQPAVDEGSPRTFIVIDELFMSIVPDGEYGTLVEMGQRTGPERSIKAEVVFPLTSVVTAASLQRQIGIGDSSTCGGCHIAEVVTDDDFFVEGAFESQVIAPYSIYEVELEALEAEAGRCDPERQPERCAVLDALFDHGDVEPSNVWSD